MVVNLAAVLPVIALGHGFWRAFAWLRGWEGDGAQEAG